jgi:hypothetical protein
VELELETGAHAMEPITVTGFDSDGEPEIRAGDNGAIEIMFNFMPPMNGTPDASPEMDAFFDRFETVLADALGVEVVRDDRELFIIPKPEPDTVARAKGYLESFWTEAWPKLSK